LCLEGGALLVVEVKEKESW